jgi:glycosyltransferase involved in cell wall biosynthesis
MERSLRSLLEQTLDDIEFILVDDRSQDSAYEIAMSIIAEKRYSHLKDNIKVIRHQENKGVPAVRRTGWEVSTGDYIYQFDSDDWMDRDMLRKLWEKAVEGDYDIVECNYLDTDGKGNYRDRYRRVQYKPYEDWIKWPSCSCVYNKIVRRSVYQNEIIWPTHPYLEDYVLMSQLYYYSRATFYLDEVLYYYYQNPSGIMCSIDKRRKVKGLKEQLVILETFMRSKGLYEKYRTGLDVFKSEAMEDAWNLPHKEFLEVFPKDRFRILTCRCIPLRTRLGHLTKLLGIHGINKLFCIIAIFV